MTAKFVVEADLDAIPGSEQLRERIEQAATEAVSEVLVEGYGSHVEPRSASAGFEGAAHPTIAPEEADR